MSDPKQVIDQFDYTGRVCTLCRYTTIVLTGLAVWKCNGCGKKHHRLKVVE